MEISFNVVDAQNFMCFQAVFILVRIKSLPLFFFIPKYTYLGSVKKRINYINTELIAVKTN